jgi:7-carboxy-7-deazaguanine synthase
MRVSHIYRGFIEYGPDAGRPAIFVRTAGSELHCSLDGNSQPTLEGGTRMNVQEVFSRLKPSAIRRLVISGEEPLLYEDTKDLAQLLLDIGREVYIETCLTVDLEALPGSVAKIIDIKCPSYGSCYQVDWYNGNFINSKDSIRFVLADRNDYVWATDVLKREKWIRPEHTCFVPRKGVLKAEELAGWILNDGLDIQLFKPLNIFLAGESGLL